MSNEEKGKVWLVGGGPGDPGLLTIKGKQVLANAQVVVYDSLVGDGVLALMPPSAKKIDAGKKAGDHNIPQEGINQILLEEALKGNRVVRLKGGDPFLFGRGGEELELLVENQVPFEIVPGVTSAIAVPAYNGIPVTHRYCTSSVHIITGHTKNINNADIDFDALVKLDGTLVFLMGVSAMEKICDALIKAGMDQTTPAAILEQGTTSKQRRVVATVSTLAEEARKAEIATPAIIVVGQVCSLSEKFHWAEERALAGIKIAITRPRDRNSQLADKLAALGAEVILLPTIKTVEIETDEAMKHVLTGLDRYNRIAFTSVAAVDIFFKKLLEVRVDVRSLQHLSFSAIGVATARAIEKRGVLVDFIPSVYSGEALGKALAKSMWPEERVLIPRAKIGTRQIIDPLEAEGISYDDMAIYDTVPDNDTPVKWDPSVDYVAFTSASTVEAFAAHHQDKDLSLVKALCIGEQTAKAAMALSMEVHVSDQATIDSMIEKLMDLENMVK